MCPGLEYKQDLGLAFSKVLKLNKTITHLNLSEASFFSWGGSYIFEALQHNTTLVHLNLNNIGLIATEDTAQALTKMLQVNNTLTFQKMMTLLTLELTVSLKVFSTILH